MAPEQILEAKTVDARADQYSLAVLVYEAVSGRLPFEARGTFELMEAICGGRAAPLSRVCPGLPAAFVEMVARAMSARVQDRYASIAVFGRELLRFSTGRAWGSWAREFGALAGAHEHETLDSIRALAVEPVEALPPGRERVSRRGGLALLPLLTFALGAAAAATAQHIQHGALARPLGPASAASTPNMLSPPATVETSTAEGTADDPARGTLATDVAPPVAAVAPDAGAIRPRAIHSLAPPNVAGGIARKLGANRAPIIE